uniref:Uncharacterized protein n=1 Tax=Oryza brachyantha TaxID=4533 RepID=J3LF20_ORYBR
MCLEIYVPGALQWLGGSSADGNGGGVDGTSAYPKKYDLDRQVHFRRATNYFFLVVVYFSFSPFLPYQATSVLVMLIVVVGVTMAKGGVKDRWRK